MSERDWADDEAAHLAMVIPPDTWACRIIDFGLPSERAERIDVRESHAKVLATALRAAHRRGREDVQQAYQRGLVHGAGYSAVGWAVAIALTLFSR